MSAYVVDLEHIHVLTYMAAYKPHNLGELSWYAKDENDIYGWRRASAEDADAVGQMLLDANVASVNARYREFGRARVYKYRRPAHTAWTPVEIIKAIECFEYQACEVENYLETEAHAFCQALKDRMINSLPGYSEAPWSITTHSHKVGA